MSPMRRAVEGSGRSVAEASLRVEIGHTLRNKTFGNVAGDPDVTALVGVQPAADRAGNASARQWG